MSYQSLIGYFIVMAMVFYLVVFIMKKLKLDVWLVNFVKKTGIEEAVNKEITTKKSNEENNKELEEEDGQTENADRKD